MAASAASQLALGNSQARKKPGPAAHPQGWTFRKIGLSLLPTLLECGYFLDLCPSL